MSKTIEDQCCKKYRRKGKACSGCPLMERLSKPERKAMLALYTKSKKKAKQAEKHKHGKGGKHGHED